MVPNIHAESICPSCGHMDEPLDPEFHCACARCRSLAVNIVSKAPSTLHR
jgi:hypothetical protein